jgi:hypothetical protein
MFRMHPFFVREIYIDVTPLSQKNLPSSIELNSHFSRGGFWPEPDFFIYVVKPKLSPN